VGTKWTATVACFKGTFSRLCFEEVNKTTETLSQRGASRGRPNIPTAAQLYPVTKYQSVNTVSVATVNRE
jgi:hypothetical protein